MRLVHWFVLIFLAVISTVSSRAYSTESGFAQWLRAFEQEAIQQGIPEDIARSALAEITEDMQVIRLDRKQPEGKIAFTQYKSNIVSTQRVQKGQALYLQHRALLDTISAHYNVPAPVIVALWGIETNYGSFTGNSSIIRSLATLAYEGRRAEFFKKELLTLLRLLASGELSLPQLKGSWAGAMGHCQFMPSSFERYAVDWNKDGKKDIFTQLPDVFASIANYLKTEGWDGTKPWGYAVKIPSELTLVYDDLYTKRSADEINSLGVRSANGHSIEPFTGHGYIMHPGAAYEGTFLVFENYHVLLHWNKSRYFATAVGLLADAIAGK